MPDRLRLVLGATGWAIDFIGCPEIAEQSAGVLAGWRPKLGPSEKFAAFPPRAIVKQQRHQWTWRAMGASAPRLWFDLPPVTPMHVVCEVHDACIDWYLAKHADYLCLHGAAAKIGNGLVCFPSQGKAGKSTLIAHLAARGQRIFCDDVLGIEPRRNKGTSLGLPPRLRVPLPRRIAQPVHRFIEKHRGYTDKQWIYLALDRSQLARFAESAPIEAFVFLNRQTKGPPQLRPATAASILKELIAQNIARKIPPHDIFERLYALATTRPGYHFSYSDPLEAASHLIKAFKDACP